MSFRPCSLCGQRKPGKQATAYNAWFDKDEVRIAWKQRLCADCLTETYAEVLKKSSSDSTGADTCVACGGLQPTSSAPVFMTLYLPKQEPREYELVLCADCADTLQSFMTKGAEELEDRSARTRGPTTSPSDPFARIGL